MQDISPNFIEWNSVGGVFFLFLGGGAGYMVPKLGLPTKYPFRVMNKQCGGNVRGVIELHNAEDGGDGGHLAEFAASFMMPWLIVLSVLPLWRPGCPAF